MFDIASAARRLRASYLRFDHSAQAPALPSITNRRVASRSSRGVALIAVLWLLALLTLLATAVATMSVSHRRAARMLENSVQLDTLADSAIRVTLLRLMAPKEGGERFALGVPQTLQLLERRVEVTVERESTRIDLNTADDERLVAVFMAHDWNDEQARAMVDRIADWKDPDDQPRAAGAERAAYAAAGLHYAPRNGPLESVDELRQVLGAREIAPELLESFTVYTHQQLPADEPPPSLVGEIVRIRACARRQTLSRCTVTIARLTGSRSNALQIFVWKRV